MYNKFKKKNYEKESIFMRKIFILASIAVFALFNLSALSQNNQSWYDSWPRKKQLEHDISKAKPGSKRYTLLVQERERIALDEIHKAQKYIVEYGNQKQKRHDKHLNTLKQELRLIEKTLAQIPDFPFADKMADIATVLQEIREGKIDFEKMQGKTLTKILSKIQNLQKKKLNAYHKQYLREKF